MILATDLPGFLQWRPTFSQMQHLPVIAHTMQVRCNLCHALVWSTFCSHLAYTLGLSTTRNHIGQLVSEPHHIGKVLCAKTFHQSSRSITHATSRLLRSCSNFRKKTCFWWQLTQNVTIHTVEVKCSICVTRSWRTNEETHDQKHTKRCIILFRSKTDTNKKQVSRMSENKDSPIVTWHTQRKTDLWAIRPWALTQSHWQTFTKRKDKMSCFLKQQHMKAVSHVTIAIDLPW